MQNVKTMSDQELRQALTDCRIILESIRPYKSHTTTARQRELRAEVERRRNEVHADSLGSAENVETHYNQPRAEREPENL